MRSDDLTGQLLPDRASDPKNQAFRQATVVAFDPTTGANTINLAGAILTNLPLLNIGDTVNLKPNDAVILGRLNGALFIMGRVVPSNGPNVLTGVAVDFQSSAAFANNFAISTSFVTKASTSITVPLWANRALVTTSVFLNVSQATSVSFQAQTLIGGSSLGVPGAMNGVIPPATTPAPGATIGFVSNGQTLAFNAVPGGSYPVEAQALSSIAVPANGFTAIGLIVNAIYTKI